MRARLSTTHTHTHTMSKMVKIPNNKLNNIINKQQTWYQRYLQPEHILCRGLNLNHQIAKHYNHKCLIKLFSYLKRLIISFA